MAFHIDLGAYVSHAMVPEPLGEQNAKTVYQPGQKDVLFGGDGFTFSDLLDIINPLQHIPVISTIYRKLTGDTIDPASRVLGGALFGGPIGAASEFVNAVVDETTGKDIGDHILALFTGDGDNGGKTAVAAKTSNKSASPETAAATSPQSGTGTADTEVARADLAPAAGGPPEAGDAAKTAEAAPPSEQPLAPAASVPQFVADLRNPAFESQPPPSPVPAATSRPGVGALDDIRAPQFDAAGQSASSPANNLVAGQVATAEQRAGEDWLYQAMLRGLDKYKQSMDLAESQQGPTQSVVR